MLEAIRLDQARGAGDGGHGTAASRSHFLALRRVQLAMQLALLTSLCLTGTACLGCGARQGFLPLGHSLQQRQPCFEDRAG
jgi:hypothetical protein